MKLSILEKTASIVKKIVIESTGIDAEIENNQSLINSGILDSLIIVTVVQSIQDVFDIDIMVPDMTVDNFDTIELIAAFIEDRIDEDE